MLSPSSFSRALAPFPYPSISTKMIERHEKHTHYFIRFLTHNSYKWKPRSKEHPKASRFLLVIRDRYCSTYRLESIQHDAHSFLRTLQVQIEVLLHFLTKRIEIILGNAGGLPSAFQLHKRIHSLRTTKQWCENKQFQRIEYSYKTETSQSNTGTILLRFRTDV